VERAREVNEARLRRRDRKAGKPGGSQRESSSDEGQKDKEQESEDREGEGEEGVDGKEDDAEPYSPGNWENLVFRYEEPNPMTKWDSPLFPIIWTDDDDQTTLVFDKLWNAIAGGNRKVIKPNKATAQRTRDVGADYLYVLDRETQDIVKKILEAGVSDGGEVKIPTEDGNEEIVVFPAGVGLARLQRLRRAFVGLHRGGIGLESVGNMDVQAIRVSFLGYLNDAFEREGE
jgi:protein KTI12